VIYFNPAPIGTGYSRRQKQRLAMPAGNRLSRIQSNLGLLGIGFYPTIDKEFTLDKQSLSRMF
jgi:hypothetical protein